MMTTTVDHKFGTVLFHEFESILLPNYKNYFIISSIIPKTDKNIYTYF